MNPFQPKQMMSHFSTSSVAHMTGSFYPNTHTSSDFFERMTSHRLETQTNCPVLNSDRDVPGTL